MDATKKITRNLGGDRLGSGAKNNISMHAYNRSNHDLSYAWRSSMTPGTLIPFMKLPMLNGDTFSIDIEDIVKTIPATGPLYGAYKLQVDTFLCPIRLYNGLLHNNMLKIGLKMEQVKLPTLTLSHNMTNPKIYAYDIENSQIATDSLVRYLGISGIGDCNFGADGATNNVRLQRVFNGVPVLAYYDIYKNYYANKQEEVGYYIRPKLIATAPQFSEIRGDYTYYYGLHLESHAKLKPVSESVLPAGETITGDTYQEVEEPAEDQIWNNNIEGGWNYTMEIPSEFNFTALEFIVEMDATGENPTTDVVPISTIFPNAYAEGTKLILGEPAEGYPSEGSTTINRFVGVGYDQTSSYYSEIELKKFELQQIDNARISILRNTDLNTAVEIRDLEEIYQNLCETDENGQTYNKYQLNGIAIKTHQSDLLNNWLNSEWIDGENGINQITAIDVSSGTFTIDALNLANKVYNMLNRIAVSGGTYEDWQEAVYSVEVTRRAETPIYCGGMAAEIVFEEIFSSAETEDKPLGTLAGRGTITGKRGGSIEVRADEPSYLMGIVSITPRVDYSQGNDWDMCELHTMNDLHKPELDGIGFEDLLQERAAWFGTYYDTVEEEWVKLAIGKTPAWINYTTNINKCYGDFADENKAMYMTLNRRYEYRSRKRGKTTMGISDMTTYVNPTKFNYSFADNSLNAENFWVQLGIRINARRVMSAKQIPSL